MRTWGVTVVGVVVLIIIVLAAWWALSTPHAPGKPPQRVPPVDTSYTTPTALTVTHAVVKGADVYSGNLPIRSCDTIAGGLSTTGINPVHITINFRVLDGDGTCTGDTAAASDTQPFSLSYSSSVSTTTPVLDTVTINGVPVPFTLAESQ